MSGGNAATENRHSDGFDGFRVVPGPALHATLVGPMPDAATVAVAEAELRGFVDRHLDHGRGVLILTGMPVEEETAATAIARISALLGEARPQNREGELVRRVRDRHTAVGQGRRSRYSDSRFGGNLHTDGAEAALPAPDVFTLYCLRQSSHGGELITVHLDEILHRIGDPALLDTLRTPFHVDRRGDEVAGESPTVEKPVLFTQNGHESISYLRSYIEIGHRRDDRPDLTAEQTAALDALDAAVAEPAAQTVGKLAEGELAIFDNLRLVHGRREFVDAPGHPRLLLRSWIRRAPIPA